MSPPRPPMQSSCALHEQRIDQNDSDIHALKGEIAALRTGLGEQLVTIGDRLGDIRERLVRLEAGAGEPSRTPLYIGGSAIGIVVAVVAALATSGHPVTVTLGSTPAIAASAR